MAVYGQSAVGDRSCIIMDELLRCVLLFLCFQLAAFTDLPCIMELQCRECVPDNPPLVTSHRAANGTLHAPHGDELLLACPGGKFLAYPLRETLSVRCEAGRYRVGHDRSLRHLLELGCQENIYEDVLHETENCGGAEEQGRAYVVAAASGTRHLAALCYDAGRGVPLRARLASRLVYAPHAERRAPLTLLGNFNHMFDLRTRRDAETLFSDDVRLNRRLRELLRHDDVALAGQELTAARLLAPEYFNDQDARAADFASNLVAAWRGVTAGNLRHLQRDVAALRRRERALDVTAGTLGVAALRSGGEEPAARTELHLRPGGRFPVPRYLWTVVVEPRSRRGVALVLLNDPLVAVSEIRAAVFCESQCGRLGWLRELRRQRRYEAPALGLVFCCEVEAFLRASPSLPPALSADVQPGPRGLLD